MNARAIIEAETPKHVFRAAAAATPGPARITITTYHWKIVLPLYTTDQGRFSNYGYIAKGRSLTQEQKAFLDEHWEEIEFSLAEHEREGTIHNFFGDEETDEKIAGTWQVTGNFDELPVGTIVRGRFNPVRPEIAPPD